MMDSIVPGIYSASSNGNDASNLPTPQQIQAAYAYANTLKAQGLNPPEPVHAWTQGVNQMLKALLGNYAGGDADNMQRQRDAYGANQAQEYGANGKPAAPFIPPAPQTPMPQNNAPASTYGTGVPYLFGGGAPYMGTGN
jgi:hypothetical protein